MSSADVLLNAGRHRPLFRRLAVRGPVEQQADTDSQARPDDLAAQRTALALAPLRSIGWSVNHGIQARRVGIDNLVIGPGGTFVVEARSITGSVRIVGDQVMITSAGGAALSGDDWACDARERAAEANKLLSTSLSQRVQVHAVVVVWGEFAQRLVEGHNVTFVHGEELAGWLRSRPVRCGAGRIAELEAALRQAA